jgi:hypothetical protein
MSSRDEGAFIGKSDPSTQPRSFRNPVTSIKPSLMHGIRRPSDGNVINCPARFATPNDLGCVDGSFIPIKAPSSPEDIYVCRKGCHALNVQGICDSQNNFVKLVVEFRGQRTMLLYGANVECKHLSVKYIFSRKSR